MFANSLNVEFIRTLFTFWLPCIENEPIFQHYEFIPICKFTITNLFSLRYDYNIKEEREREKKKTALPSNPEFFTTLHFTSLLPWARHLINTRVPLPKDTAACPLLATCKSLNPLQFGAEHQPLSLHFLIVIIISDVFHSEFALIH